MVSICTGHGSRVYSRIRDDVLGCVEALTEDNELLEAQRGVYLPSTYSRQSPVQCQRRHGL